MSLKVALLMGGWSAEREVSLISGKAVAQALGDLGHAVKMIDPTRDVAALVQALTPLPDVVFNALHGRGGEDGRMQAVLDIIGVPYTHSGVLASALAMDKAATKRVLSGIGVPCAEGMVAAIEQVMHGGLMPAPFVVKPVNEGSSVGVRIVRDGDNLPPVDESWTYGSRVLVERYIPGRDLTVAVMGGKDGAMPRALAVTEIQPRIGFYDYEAKYTEGKADHIVPAEIPKPVYDEAMRLAVLAHETLGCVGISRSDFRWDDSKIGISGLYFLELNTQPGFTPLSLVPEQAAYLGISFNDLVAWILENATCGEA
jgi:D-alanine-D-alanine ligase